jgi:hypothetical protein
MARVATETRHKGHKGRLLRFAPIRNDVEMVASQVALCLELEARNIPFERECPVSVVYRSVAISGQGIDLIVG